MHWLWFHLGLSSGNTAWYLFPSGWGGILLVSGSILSVPFTTWRRHNCRHRRCPWIGHYGLTDPATGVTEMLCWRHHPDKHHKHMTGDRIAEIQKRRHLYLGSKPGRG